MAPGNMAGMNRQLSQVSPTGNPTSVVRPGSGVRFAGVTSSGGSPATTPIGSRAEAEGYVAMVCFKHGPPRLYGVELEWTVHHAEDPHRPLDAGHLRKALGVHAPPTLVRTARNCRSAGAPWSPWSPVDR